MRPTSFDDDFDDLFTKKSKPRVRIGQIAEPVSAPRPVVPVTPSPVRPVTAPSPYSSPAAQVDKLSKVNPSVSAYIKPTLAAPVPHTTSKPLTSQYPSSLESSVLLSPSELTTAPHALPLSVPRKVTSADLEGLRPEQTAGHHSTPIPAPAPAEVRHSPAPAPGKIHGLPPAPPPHSKPLTTSDPTTNWEERFKDLLLETEALRASLATKDIDIMRLTRLSSQKDSEIARLQAEVTSLKMPQASSQTTAAPAPGPAAPPPTPSASRPRPVAPSVKHEHGGASSHPRPAAAPSPSPSLFDTAKAAEDLVHSRITGASPLKDNDAMSQGSSASTPR